jgi:hypothetical protein
MAKKRTEETDITKVSGVNANWLQNYVEEDHSLDGMEEYRVVPILKVVQSMTDQELKKEFGEGAVIMRPGNQLVCSEGESFLFVPIFFFAEFTKRSDLNDKESPMTLQRSFDQSSDLAQLARDPDKRSEVYPGMEGRPEKDQMHYRYVESLRFAGVIYGDHDLTGTPCSLSFERGEFSQGKNFVSAIRLRKTKVETPDGIKAVPVPLWAQVWEIGSVFRDKGAKKWYGIDFRSPDENIISDNNHENFLALHNELRELHEKQLLLVQEDGEDEEVIAPDEDSEV